MTTRGSAKQAHKPGKHGTLYLWRVAYKDTNDPGFGESSFQKWAYDKQDALDAFNEQVNSEGESWEIVKIEPVLDTGPKRLSFDEARQHRVADFNTINDLIAHAKRELGATHVSGRDAGTRIYFPTIESGYKYEVSSVWEKGGYWHAQAPSDRTLTKNLPRDATPIDNRIHWPHNIVQDYEAVDPRDRVIAGPFKSYGDARNAAGPADHVRFVPSRGRQAPPRASEAHGGQQFEVVSPGGGVIGHITARTIERAQDDLARAKNAGRYPRGSRIKGARMDASHVAHETRSAHNPIVGRGARRR